MPDSQMFEVDRGPFENDGVAIGSPTYENQARDGLDGNKVKLDYYTRKVVFKSGS